MKTKEEIKKMIDKLGFENREKIDKRYCNVNYTGAIEEALLWVIEEENSFEEDIKEALDEVEE